MWKSAAGAVGSLLVAALAAGSAYSFVVIEGEARPEDPLAALAQAPRWQANTESFVASGERGLGGGLEFSVDAKFCDALDFDDDPSCEQIHAAIAEAGRKWSAGHPLIRFVDVTEAVATAESAGFESNFGRGAEIDFFARRREGTDFFADGASAVTHQSINYLKPRSTSGATLWDSAGTIAEADIYFSADKCYYLQILAPNRDCVHFGSLLMHELGHVLGLDHPEEFTAWNVDSDGDPKTLVDIDCRDPRAGLRHSENYERDAVAVSEVNGDRNWRIGPTVDDLAGRDFLYPFCAEDEGREMPTTE